MPVPNDKVSVSSGNAYPALQGLIQGQRTPKDTKVPLAGFYTDCGGGRYLSYWVPVRMTDMYRELKQVPQACAGSRLELRLPARLFLFSYHTESTTCQSKT